MNTMPRFLSTLAPFIAALAWLTTMLILFILWMVHGRQRYELTAPRISYISNIGAHYKTVFIIGASVTSAFFVATLLLFVYRHRKLQQRYAAPEDRERRELRDNPPPKQRLAFDILSLLTGLISSAALVLLTVFDSKDYDTLHWICTLVFAFSVIICAIFNLVSVAAFRKVKKRIRTTYILKLFFIIAATLVLGTMIYLMYSCKDVTSAGTLTPKCDDRRSVSAILEWSLGILFFVFLLTWVIDGLA